MKLGKLDKEQEKALEWLVAMMAKGGSNYFEQLMDPPPVPNHGVAKIDNDWVVIDFNKVDPADIL